MSKRLSLYLFTKIITYALAVVMAMVASLLFLLSTEVGSRFTVNQTSRWVHEWVQFESFEGTLLRDFNFNNVNITLPGEQVIQAEQLRFRWRPWQLLQNQLHIRLLDIHGITITLPEAENNSAPIEWPLQLPQINFNLRLRLDHLLMENIAVQVAHKNYHVSRLQSRGRFENNTLRIHDLQVDTPEARLQLRAELTPQDDYHINVQGEIHAPIPEIGNVSANYKLEGNILDRLMVSIETSGGVGALAKGDIEGLLSGDPNWNLDATLYTLNHPSVHEHVSNFTVQFHGQGNLRQADGHLLITGTAHEYGLITLQADGVFAEANAELSHFSINASEVGLETSINGKAHIAPDALIIEMAGKTQWRDFPQVLMSLSYKGDFKRVDDLLLQFKTELGAITVAGNAAWDIAPKWDVELHTEAVQLDRLMLPFEISQYIHNSLLNSEIKVQGEWSTDRHYVQLDIAKLATVVDNQALLLSGSATIDQQSLRLTDFELLLGDGHIQASGFGEVNSLTLQVNGRHLQFDGFSLAQLSADLWLDTSFNKLPLGEISFRDFARSNGLAPTSVDIVLTENERYRAQLNGSGADLDAAIVITGQWHENAWQGAVEQLELSYPDFGQWTLNKPTEFSFDAISTQIAPFCLQVNLHDAELCAALNWVPAEQNVQADLSLRHITLSLFEQWLPNTIAAHGIVNLEAHYNQLGFERTYHGYIHLEETRLELPEQDVNLILSAGNILEFQGNEQRLDGRVTINTDAVDGGLVGVFALDSPFVEPNITAEVDLDFASLRILSLLIPEIQNVRGEVAGHFQLNGPLAKPTIAGELALCCAGAEVPSAGLVLDSLNFHIQSPKAIGDPFTMSGSVRSGEGMMQLEGRYQLATHIAQFDISGENFTAMNSREIQLVVSPQAQVDVGHKLMRVRGTIAVPRALITPPDFKSVDLSSNDTIISRGEDTLWESSSQSIADIDVQMSLGESFSVNAFGFDGRLAGRLRVIEKPGQDTTAVGSINVASGRYELYGQALNIDRGTLVFTGGIITNPGLDLRVSRNIELDKVTVGARVGGSLQEPNLSLFSTPTMQDAEILSYLVFGRGFGEEAGEDQNMLLQASLALGMQGGNVLGQRLSESLGVDDIMLDGGDNFESTSLYIGKHLSPRLYIKYGIGLVEPVNTFFIRYRLNDFLNFETQTGTLGSGADLFYSIER